MGGRPAAPAGIMVRMRRALPAGGFLAVMLSGCLGSGTAGTLAPTLEMVDAGGLPVAVQNGIAVPTFDWQPRPRIDLDGTWRVDRVEVDSNDTLTDRDTSLATIEADGAGRHLPGHDDGGWDEILVPGSFNPPPDGEPGAAWYRRSFAVPEAWSGRAVTLRIGSASYVADVWLNGTWLGYHEGGETPFALPVGEALLPGTDNVLVIRVDAVPLGTRSDIMPWGATDWWNYGGLTGSVWLESTPQTHLVRADAVPHLDAVDFEVLVARDRLLAGVPPTDGDGRAERPGDGEPGEGTVRLTIYPASVDPDNVLDPDPRSLVPDDAEPLLVADAGVGLPRPDGHAAATVRLEFGDADVWSPAVPSLYVLHAQLLVAEPNAGPRESGIRDELWTTFGIRHVGIDPAGPSVLLNGERMFLRGVGLHDEALTFTAGGLLAAGSPAPSAAEVLADLREAAALGADFIRAGHEPPDPVLLMLADRLGFAVWEEIPLYHATPVIFERTMGRGIPQQMLREMALRDMNRPSVLFHGFANESTGEDERTDALRELHEIDRAIDGTRLTGQAAYGWRPEDPTHAPLDVAGFTSYHGVFYGTDPEADTRAALAVTAATHPDKPIVVLEFGRWADTPADEVRQREVFAGTWSALTAERGDRLGGAVAVATWWSLQDFATPLADIGVEQFGLLRPDGSLRPAGEAARESFLAPGGRGDALALEPNLTRSRVRPERVLADWSLLAYLAYALALSVGALGGTLLILTRRGGRASGRRRVRG